MNTILIYVRPGLVLAPDELLDHRDDPDVARIIEERWPPLFAPEDEDDPYIDDEPHESDTKRFVPPKTELHRPPFRPVGSPPWGEP